MLILPVFLAGNKGWFEQGTKPCCQDVTCRVGECGGLAGAHTYDKPRNPTENFHYSGSTAAVLYLSLPSEDEEEDYDEAHNGDYMRVFSRGDES